VPRDALKACRGLQHHTQLVCAFLSRSVVIGCGATVVRYIVTRSEVLLFANTAILLNTCGRKYVILSSASSVCDSFVLQARRFSSDKVS
jgi:hypothetical protein